MNTQFRTEGIPETLLFPSSKRTAEKVATDLKTKPGSTSVKNHHASAKKANSQRRTIMTAKPGAKTAVPKRKPRKNKAPELSVAVKHATLAPADSSPKQNFPAVCEILPKQAELIEQLESDGVTESECLSASETQTETNAPVESMSPLEVSVPNEPELPAETITLVANETPALQETAAQVEQGKALTTFASFWKSLASFLTQGWKWTQEKLKSHQVGKRLRVCETVSLGEKRFLAVIQVDGEQFLVGGSSSSVSTLAHLERPREFSDVFQRHCEQDLSRA